MQSELLALGSAVMLALGSLFVVELKGRIDAQSVARWTMLLAGTMTGTAAVVDGSFWRELVHPGDAQRYRDALASLTAADASFAVVEYRVRHRDGAYLTVVDSMRAVRDGDGATIEVVGAWMDVSARSQ